MHKRDELDNTINVKRWWWLTTELATMIMMQEKYVPINGVSDDGGCISDTTFMKKVRDIWNRFNKNLIFGRFINEKYPCLGENVSSKSGKQKTF